MIKIQSFGSGSSGNGYLIDDGRSQLMIECGVRFAKVQQAMGFDFSNVAGCLITHEHRDHCRYVRHLLDNTSVEVYATGGTFDAMIHDPQLKISNNDHYRLHPLKYRKTVEIANWYVTAFETKHDAEQPCGYLIDNEAGDRLVFITDSYYVKYRFPRVTHMMVEANFAKEIVDENIRTSFDKKHKTRLLGSHFDIEQTLSFIKANKSGYLQEVWLLHLSDNNSNEEVFKNETKKITGTPVYIA